jgi:transposase
VLIRVAFHTLIMNQNDSIRERICQFFVENCKLGNKATLEHFKSERVARSTIYDAIQRVKNNVGAKRRPGQGRIARKMPKTKVKRLLKYFNHHQGRSQRKAARKFNIAQPYVHTLLRKGGIKCRKKKTIPDRSESQALAAKGKCRILIEKYRDRHWILDDESYFTLSNSSLAGNDVYYTSDPALTPAIVKYKKKKKFELKLLVWVAISRKGISKLFICPSGQAINQYIYREECLQRRLIPFINRLHSEDDPIFWPDLASAHYAETVCDFMIEENISFVDKHENPANLPECRPIELFWASLKRLVYEANWQAKNLDQLELRIRNCLKKMDTNILENLFDGMLHNLKDVARNGVIEKK